MQPRCRRDRLRDDALPTSPSSSVRVRYRPGRGARAPTAHRRAADRASTGRTRPRPRAGCNRLVYDGDLPPREPRRLGQGARAQGARRPHRASGSRAARASCRCSPARAASARRRSRRCSAWRWPTSATTASSPSTPTPTAARSPSGSTRQTRATVRDVVDEGARRSAASPTSRRYVSRDETRLDILASDTDPTALRGLRRRRLQRRRRPRRPLLLDRAHRLRHRHRALGHAGDAAARRLDRHRLGRQRRRGAARLRDPHLARGERLRRPRAQRDRRAQHGHAGHATS